VGKFPIAIQKNEIVILFPLIRCNSENDSERLTEKQTQSESELS